MVAIDPIDAFLQGARTVARAIADPVVAEYWDQPSVLEDQLVGGLAGHLARGGVWVVGDYLEAGTPEGPTDFSSAAMYFATLVSSASAKANLAIRERGAAVAAVGPASVARTLTQRLDLLSERLTESDGRELIAVVGGKVMHLADYLTTRIVEQTVHLDDLARSIEREPWPVPDECLALTIEVGIEIAQIQSGPTAMIRSLYRAGMAGSTLPVL